MTENSRVISFRLNQEIEDERQALWVLERWEAQGLKARQVIVRALLELDGIPLTADPVDLITELRQAIQDSQGLLEALRHNGMTLHNAPPSSAPEVQSDLKPDFRAAIKKAVRPGLKVE